MEDIDFVHMPNGSVKVYTTTEPYMEVVALTYEIGKHIIEKNLVWMVERAEAVQRQREVEMQRALSEVINIKQLPSEDTAPSEILNTDHYMDGNNHGC